jgi:hypothetical protein
MTLFDAAIILLAIAQVLKLILIVVAAFSGRRERSAS